MRMPKPKHPKCACCQGTQRIQWHHLGGKLFDLLVAACYDCHLEVTVGLARLKIETSEKKGSVTDSCRALVYFLWFFLDKFLARVEPRNRSDSRKEESSHE